MMLCVLDFLKIIYAYSLIPGNHSESVNDVNEGTEWGCVH